MRATYLAFCFLLLAALFAYAQTSKQSFPEGRITGVVLNEEGQPVEHAWVCTTIYEQHGSMTGCQAHSGENGKFQIDHWPMGTLSLFAIKPEDGYTPEGKRLTAKITLTPQAPLAVVTVKLGTKIGLLTGSVKDKITGKPVEKVSLKYIAVDGSIRGCGLEISGSSSSGSSFEVPLPTAVDLIVILSSPGYKTWFYTDANDARPVMRLQSGERKWLEIEVEPADPSTNVSSARSY